MKNKIWTIKELLDWSSNYFSEKNIESARLDAELLLSWVLDLKRLDLYLQFDRPLTEIELQKYKKLIKRRIDQEPIAYIIGEKEFYGRNFKVNSSTLIPRPDTETLIEISLKKFPDKNEELNILDIGTGSGVLAITLALEYPNSKITAIDVSKSALEIATQNSLEYKLENRINFIEKDFLKEDLESQQKYDLIISNPPYIPSKNIESLDKNVKNFEPLSALDGGKNGLIFYEKMSNLYSNLQTNSWLLFEIGYDQSPNIKEIFSSSKWKNLSFHQDLAGINRVASLQNNI